MSVSIEDVLALLPELFPGEQPIPLKNIKPNPYNPGPAFTQEQIDKMAEDLKENGLLNAITVRPHPTQPLVNGVQLHPTDPSLGVAGLPIEPAQLKSGPQLEASVQVIRPWKLDDFNFEILGGHLRTLGAEKLEWPTIRGVIKVLNDEDAAVYTHKDNEKVDKGWFADYQAIENLIRANPYATTRRIKDRLGFDREKISRALGLLPLLSEKSRNLIGRNTATKNKGNSEIAFSRLGGLGPESTNKPGARQKALAEGLEPPKLWPYPPIPSETQDKVYQALQMAIDEQMTESQVKNYINWIKAGNRPEDYTPQKVANFHTKLAQPNHDPRLEASGQAAEYLKAMKAPVPNPQGEGHAVGVPKPKQGMGTQSTQTDPGARSAHPPVNSEKPNPTPITSPKVEGVQPSEPLPGETAPSDTAETIHPGSKTEPGESRTDTSMVSAQTGHGRRLESDDQSVFWGTMAGIPWIKAIRAKIKARQDLTLWEKLFLVAAFFGRILHWTWHTSWPLAKSSFRWVGSRIKKALNGTLRFLGEVVGKPAKKVIQGVVGIALVLGLAYGLYLFFFHPAGLRGLVGRATSGVIHWVGSWVNPWEGDSKSIPQPQPTTIPTPGPKPPVSDQALAVPISISDLGTPVPTPVVVKT